LVYDGFVSREETPTLAASRLSGCVVRASFAWAAWLLALTLVPVTAGAATTVDALTASLSTAQAGAHPDLSVSFSLGSSGEAESAETATLGTPVGYFLYPDSVPLCSNAEFASFECPNASQAGLITLYAKDEGEPSYLLGTAPVYSLAPEGEQMARLGFAVLPVDLPVEVPVTVRTSSNYGLDFSLQGLPQSAPLATAKLTLWGVPAAPEHNNERCTAAEAFLGCVTSPSRPPGMVETPLLLSPTRCGVPLTISLAVTTYEHPSDVVALTTSAPQATGCNHLPFGPWVEVEPTSRRASTPTGLDMTIKSSPSPGVKVLEPSETRSLELELPPELIVDPEATAEQTTCTDSQFKLDLDESDECPAGSAVGTFTVGIGGFASPLEGTAYFGTPESGETYRLLLVAPGLGTSVKLVVELEPGPEDEQVTIVSSDLPQIPLTELKLHLAPEAELLITPKLCGIYSATTMITPWSGGFPAVSLNEFELDSVGPDEGPCPGPATGVEVLLSPETILADGSSTSIATATVTDDNEIGVFGEEVSFASSDLGETIGPIADNGDGTYTAEITSSETAGASAVTATDTSVEPEVLGTATLLQLSPVAEPPPAKAPAPAEPKPVPPDPAPVVTISGHPGRRTRDRTPTFRFSSSKPGSTFECKVDNRPFRRCASPETVRGLALGKHVFRVRAMDAAGNRGPAGLVIWRVVAEK
jgi:hypothetical protein